MAPACQTETEVQHRQVEKLCPDPNAIGPVGMEDQYLNADQYQVESCDQIQENNDLLCPFSVSVHEKCEEAPGRQESEGDHPVRQGGIEIGGHIPVLYAADSKGQCA